VGCKDGASAFVRPLEYRVDRGATPYSEPIGVLFVINVANGET
jgi:hypothetical protein